VAVPEPVWSYIIEHPVEGKISLETWMERQERHIPHHIDQMRENYELWLKDASSTQTSVATEVEFLAANDLVFRWNLLNGATPARNRTTISGA